LSFAAAIRPLLLIFLREGMVADVYQARRGLESRGLERDHQRFPHTPAMSSARLSRATLDAMLIRGNLG